MTLPLPFIADENIPDSVIRALRARGCDVLSVKESLPARSDETILARGQEDGRHDLFPLGDKATSP